MAKGNKSTIFFDILYKYQKKLYVITVKYFL